MIKQDNKKIDSAKSMASNPYINFRTSSDELEGSSNAFPPDAIAEVTVAIKPKAIRLRPVTNHSSEIEFNGDYVEQQQILVDGNSQAKKLTQVICNVQNQSTLNLHQSLTPLSNTNKLFCSSTSVCMSNKSKARAQQPISSGDRNSSDGYTWRKYGQKQVKGSEYPRGYYRCTQPGCPVKKIVERSQDGEISEIVYKGDHNHPKLQREKLPSSSSRLRSQAFVLHENRRNYMDNSVINDSLIEEPLFENMTEYWYNEGFLVTESTRKAQLSDDTYMPTSGISLSSDTDCQRGVFSAMDSTETSSQKRKNDDKFMESTLAAKTTPLTKLAASKEYDQASDDGYRWRKYGQKAVKGNSYPRCYYRCTGQTCSARKYVERDSDDPNLFVITYEGEHKHDLPDEKP